MAFTHYPKTEFNIVFAWVWPRPPKQPPFAESMPSFDDINLIHEPLAPGKTLHGYASAQGYTRFYSSLAGDQPMKMQVEFSNDEIGPGGLWVTDETLPKLHYDVLERDLDYKVGDRKGHWMLILGRWIHVAITNTGDKPLTELRAYVRGSVF